MPVYKPPLRDMQFVMHEVLHVTDEFKQMPAHTDIDADSFAADQGGSITANGTSGISSNTDIAFTSGAQMDSLAAGEPFRLRVTRDGDGTTGTDNATGDAQLWLIEMRET